MKFFAYDSPLMNFLAKATDLVLLNLIYLLCCIPIITIGASTTALYASINKLQNDEGQPFKQFFITFKQDFKQSTIFFVLFVSLMAFIALDVYIVMMVNFSFSVVFFAAFGLIAVLIFFTSCFFYPLVAMFENTLKSHVLNSLKLSLAKLPISILMAIISLVPLLILVFLPLSFFIQVIIFWITIGFSLTATINHILLKSTFDILKKSIQNDNSDQNDKEE